MLLYWTTVIVLIIKQNAVESKTATTPLKPEISIKKSEMARLINIVKESKNHDKSHDRSDNYDDKVDNYDRYDNDGSPNNDENILVNGKDFVDEKLMTKNVENGRERNFGDNKNDKREKGREDHPTLRSGVDLISKLILDGKISQTYGVAEPLDLNYFDINERQSIKERDNIQLKKDKKFLQKMLIERAEQENGVAKKDIRLHFIRNPTVLEEYRKNIIHRRRGHVSTSSETSDESDDSDYENIESYSKRRNAVFRLGRPSNKNSRSALRNNNNQDDEYFKQTPRAYDNEGKEKIVVAFKEMNNDDYYDKPRKSDKKQNRNKDYDSNKKDDWDAVTKNLKKDDFWDNKNDKYEGNKYKKEDRYEDDNRYKRTDKKDKNRYDDKKNDNYYKKEDGNKNVNRYKKVDNNKNYNKKDNYNDEKKYNNDYDNTPWSKKESKSKVKSKNDWDKPIKTDNSWDNWKPKSQEQDRKQDKNQDRKQERKQDIKWEKEKERPKKTTKRQASVERYTKNDYNDFKIDKELNNGSSKKKTTSEWDRAIASRSPSNPKSNNGNQPYAAKIAEYYHPKPRNHDSREKGGGVKSFGRTSIPFVGKKGIYEDK